MTLVAFLVALVEEHLESNGGLALLLPALAMAGTRFFTPELYAFSAGLPFMVIGAYAAWHQLRVPSAEKTASRLEAIRGMSWDDFAAAVEAGFRRDGYAVSRLEGAGAGAAGDFELAKDGRRSLVSCKRWKAGRTGVEPLRELHAASRKREAHECLYLAAGEISRNAAAFAAENRIRLVHGAELAALVGTPR